MNLPYRASRYLGQLNRWRFRRTLARLKPVEVRRQIPLNLVFFSSDVDYLEQAASIRSFLRNAGRPQRLLIVSDGSHSERTKTLLRQLDSCVEIEHWRDFVDPQLPPKVRDYARSHPFGKKLSIVMSLAHRLSGPSIYSDSDVLFFPQSSDLASLVEGPGASPFYLLDCWPSLDPRLIYREEEMRCPVNGGFLIFRSGLDWGPQMERFEAMEGEPSFFSEQTLVHLAVKAGGGQPLPPARYILRADDQTIFPDTFASQRIALRHYISSIRYKMWHHVHLFS